MTHPSLTRPHLTRRAALALGAAALVPRLALAQTGPAIHVVKDPGCPCCGDWIAVLQAEGFAVTVEVMEAEALQGFKQQSGIPQALASCHTARVGDYMIEGHVPPADIRRLLAEGPQAVGLAVPGMPWGSPGMGPEAEREAYEVLLIASDGTSTVFARYEAA